MASTIKDLHEAVMAGPDAQRAMRALVVRCQGTTSSASEQRVPWIGQHLILVATDYGSKEVCILGAMRYSQTDAQRAAFRRVMQEYVPSPPPNSVFAIPNRISGAALDRLIEGLKMADQAWPIILAEEAARLKAEGEAKAAEAATTAKQREEENTLILRWLNIVANATVGSEIRLGISPEERTAARRMLDRAAGKEV